jgi:hypothetical protein
MSKKTMTCAGAIVLFFIVGIAGLSTYSAAGGPLPDLVVSAIDFKMVSQHVDAKGNKYWIFDVYITVANIGKEDAGKFQVLLTRNIGTDGSFVQACPACWPTLGGLRAGEKITLPPFQFNNAMGANCAFNAKADYPGNVEESDETNNTRTETFVQ